MQIRCSSPVLGLSTIRSPAFRPCCAGASTAVTAGLGNPVVSTAENGAAIGLSFLALTVPALALSTVLVLVAVVVVRIRRHASAVGRGQQAEAAKATLQALRRKLFSGGRRFTRDEMNER